HIAKIADDQSADVAQPQLARDFIGRFQIGLQDCLVHIASALVAAGIHVDRDQSFSLINHDVAAALQPNLAMKGIINLFLHAEGFKNWRCAIVIMQTVAGAPGNVADERAHSIERGSIIAHHLIDFLGEEIAHGAFDQVGLFENAVWRRMIRNFLLDLAPLIEEKAQIANKMISIRNIIYRDPFALATLTRAVDFIETTLERGWDGIPEMEQSIFLEADVDKHRLQPPRDIFYSAFAHQSNNVTQSVALDA